MSEYKEELVNAVIEMIKQDLPHDWSCLYDCCTTTSTKTR
jgi:hypothetical protein